MKVLLIAFVCLFFVVESFTQQFVKITEGPHVNDGGDSRSVNWIDHDGDGWLDIFVSNGPSGGQNNFLYKNNGDETFSKITGIAIHRKLIRTKQRMTDQKHKHAQRIRFKGK